MTRVLRASTAKLVEHTADICGLSDELRHRTHIFLAAGAVLFLLPFSVNNFFQDRFLLGAASLFIVLLLAFSAWTLARCTTVNRALSLAIVFSIISFIYFCFNRQGSLAVFWCYPSVVVFYFILPEAQARAVNLLALAALLPEVWQFLRPELALRAMVTLLLVSLSSAIFIYLLGQQQRQMRELAVKDPLTGVFNRLLLDTFLERSVLLADRGSQAATLVSIDIDHFKLINDTFGHEAGDIVLSKFSQLLLKRVRRSDVVFRLGGEEFLLLLMDTDSDSGVQVAEQLRTILKQTELLPDRQVTASMGVATFRPGESWQRWLRRSDQAVYRAKGEGRDRVVAAH